MPTVTSFKSIPSNFLVGEESKNVLLFYPIPTHVQEKFSVPSIWSAVIVTSKPLSLALTSHELLRYIFALTQDTRLILYPTLIIIVALLGFCNTFNMYKPPIPDVIT